MNRAKNQGEMAAVKIKAYNFQPEIWEGVTPPPGTSNNQKALENEKKIKFTLTGDPIEHKKFSRSLKKSKLENMQRISPPKYDKHQTKMKASEQEQQKKDSSSRNLTASRHKIRPDLDNALDIFSAPVGLKKDEHLYKFKIPVYNNQEKAQLNMLRTEYVHKTDSAGNYELSKKTRTVKTAAEFSSMIKRKQKNELKKNELLIDVAGQKFGALVSDIKKGLGLPASKNRFNDGDDELEESEFEGQFNQKQRDAEKTRLLQHDISKTHNFQLDTRTVDQYLNNILDVTATGKQPNSNIKIDSNSQVDPKLKLDHSKPFGKETTLKSGKVTDDHLTKTNNFVVDSAVNYKQRMVKIKGKNEEILRKDHRELFTEKVPNQQLKNLVEQRGGGRGGLMGVYSAFGELKKQGFKGQFIDDQVTKFDERKSRLIPDSSKNKRTWKQIEENAEKLHKVKEELPRELAKKWVDGVQRYENLEDLLKDADRHIETKEKNLRKEIRNDTKNPRADVDEIMQKTRMLKQIGELKSAQEREKITKLVDQAQLQRSQVEEVEDGSDLEDEQDRNSNSGAPVANFDDSDNVYEDPEKKRSNQDQEESQEEDFDEMEDQDACSNLQKDREDDFEEKAETDQIQPTKLSKFDSRPEELSEGYDNPHEEEEDYKNQNRSENSEAIGSDQEENALEEKIKPKIQQIADNPQTSSLKSLFKPKHSEGHNFNNPASPETVAGEVSNTDLILKQIREAQEKVNREYKDQISAVEKKIQEAKSKAAALQDPLRFEIESKQQTEALKKEESLKDKNITSAKKRIYQGLSLIESIKSSVTGIDIEKAIELKDSYDKLNHRFRYLQTPVPDNKEFANLYLDKKNTVKTGDSRPNIDQQPQENVAQKPQDPREIQNRMRFDRAQKQLSDGQKKYVLSKLISDDPDLDARMDINHPWINMDQDYF